MTFRKPHCRVKLRCSFTLHCVGDVRIKVQRNPNRSTWKSLNAIQRAIYVEMVARYDGSNNGCIPYSVRDAANALHISKATAFRSLAVLKERGFIVPIKRGAFSLKLRHATEWRLTEFNCDLTGALPSKDFAKWHLENQNTVSPESTMGTVVKPIGTSSETVTSKNSPDGISGETVTADFGDSRFHQRYTNKLPGSGAPSVSALSVQAIPDFEISPDLEIPKFLRVPPCN